MNGFIAIGIDWESSLEAVRLAESPDDVWAVVGHHPNHAHEFQVAMLGDYRNLCRQAKVVAVGEIGLDNHWDFATKEEQLTVFHSFLDLAAELGSPVVLHCREAYPELLDILEQRPLQPCIFHCFAGTSGEFERALKLEASFGVDGPLTYPKAVELREIMTNAPRDKVVLETDSPYLSPVPYRGKPNSPAYLPLIAAELGRLWQSPISEVERITDANARRCFGLPKAT